LKVNPAFKGKWYAPMIDNPEYKGEWAPRKIANPGYFEDNDPVKSLEKIVRRLIRFTLLPSLNTIPYREVSALSSGP